MFKLIKICAVLLFLTACNSGNQLSEMTINTENGSVSYFVENVETKEAMSKGLMGRKELKADSGMVFNVNKVFDIAMWMKDTYIPLDILFVNKNGKIIWIVENTVPLSTNLIRPNITEQLSVVIELNAGDVKKHNIKLNDTVTHKFIKN